MIGYGTDIGPEGICYRADLFKKAGLPTDREEVAALMGTWDDYFATRRGVRQEGPRHRVVRLLRRARAGHAQPGREPLRDRRQHRRRSRTPSSRPSATTVTGNIEKGLSTKLAQWSDDWTASFQNDGFATMACPGWMLGVIEGNAEGVEGWDIANVFPGGGGNWGGSFLTVPAQGENVEEAKEVAAWLTAPEQQVKAFAAKGTFPSQVEALELRRGHRRDERVLQRRTHRRDPRRARRRR